MKIEELVPTLKTCSGIPGGHFDDSAFVWASACGEQTVLIREGLIDEAVLFPAPTLEEIVKGAGKLRLVPYKGGKAGDHDGPATGIAVMMGEALDDDGRKSYLMELCEYGALGKPDFPNSARGAAEAALVAWLRIFKHEQKRTENKEKTR